MSDDFDISISENYREGQDMSHAFTYVYWRILQGKPIPAIPMHINTYYPPN